MAITPAHRRDGGWEFEGRGNAFPHSNKNVHRRCATFVPQGQSFCITKTYPATRLKPLNPNRRKPLVTEPFLLHRTHTLLATYKCALCDFVLASLVHAYRQFSLKLSKALCRIIVPRFRSLFRLCFRVQNLKRDASLFALVRFCPQKPVETRERHRGT